MDCCMICDSHDLESILYQAKVPASLSSPPQGKPEVYGSLNIVACNGCSHIFNKDFSEDVINQLYAQEYSASLPVSERVRNRFKDVAEKVIGLEHFNGKNVIEVGASDFTFSENLIGYGANRVVAIEPSAIFKTDNPKIIHVNDYATEEHIKTYFPSADTVVMRHVMEHVTDPAGIIRNFARHMRQGSHFYVEVPNVEDILGKKRPYEFFYEHVSYFSPFVLEQMLESYGLEPVKRAMLIDGQHFGVLARRTFDPVRQGSPIVEPNASVLEMVEPFKRSIKEFDSKFNEVLARYDHDRLAIYGAGGHTISLVTRLGLSPREVKYLLDQSPVKAGKLAPMCHIPIVKPTNESVEGLDCIVIIASLHQDEIKKDLRDRWGFKGEIVGTYPDVSVLT